MRSPALITACSKAGCYAVLASLSGRYPPLEGRSPTCYSPVRHSVTPCGATAFDLHVLGTPPALILSQDQTLMLNLSSLVPPPAALARRQGLTQEQLANTRSFYDLLLRCCLSKVGWFRKARRLTPTLLILRRAVLSAFYPVFKEPGSYCRPQLSLGEPYNLTTGRSGMSTPTAKPSA